MATLAVLRETVLPNFLNPVPTDETLRLWFEKWRVHRYEANPIKKRGGRVWWSVADVEKRLMEMVGN